MAYGELKVDSITFTDGGSDATVSVSGLVKNPTFSGNIVVNGNISGTTITGDSAGFGSVTGTTVTGTTANFVSGVFTTQISGAVITGNTAGFTTITGTTVTGTTGNFVTVSGTTVTGDAAQFTSITGGTAGFTTVTGTTVTGTTANFNTVSGTTVTGGTGNFTSISATTTTITSGVFASGTEAAPSVSVGTTDNGLYSPGTDKVAISTNGAERVEFGTSEVVFNDGGADYDFRIEGDTEANLFFVDASTDRVGLGTSDPDELLHIEGDTAEFKGTNTNPIEATAGTEQVFKFGIEGQKSNVYGAAGSIIFRQDGNSWSTTNQYAKPTRIEFCTQDSSTSDASETPRLVIDQDGNVGIGTTSPTEALEVAGNAILDASNAKLNIKAGGAGNTGSLNYTFNTDDTVYGGLDLSYDNRITDGLRLFSESYPITIDFNAGNFFRVKDSNNEYLRVDSSGRLLAGTSSAFTGFNGGLIAPFVQIAGDSNNTSSAGFIRTDNSAAGSAINFAKSRSTSYAIVQEDDELGRLDFQGADGTDLTVGARIAAFVDGTPGDDDMPGRLVFSVTADSASSPTEALRISNDRSITVSDGGDVVLGTTTGTKIGTATSQKIGFYNATPVVQPTTGVAEAAFVENSGGTAVNVDSTFGGYTIQQVVEALQTLGLLA